MKTLVPLDVELEDLIAALRRLPPDARELVRSSLLVEGDPVQPQLSDRSDPVLAELWDNDDDAAYDAV